MKHFRLLSAAIMLLATSTIQAQKYVGGDISMLPEYEKKSAKYYDKSGSDISTNLLEFFVDQGWNAARVRLFVDPSKASETHQREGVRQDLEFVKALGKRIKDAGMTFMLDFHYSDTWTDPGKHSTPSAWSGKTATEIANEVYSYTKDCLQQLKAAGATPDFIQPGNEITYGMLWPTGHVYPNGGGQDGGTWDNFTNYLVNAIKACNEECPQAKIVIQSEMHNASLVVSFFAQLAKYPAVKYDVIGLSYYPHYHGTLATLNSTLKTLETTYPDKKIQIVETAYYHKWYPDDATFAVTTFPNWPATEAGQQQFTKDLIAALNNHSNVDGLYWWFPEANEYGVDSDNPVTKDRCNYSLFDNETGRVLSALYELQSFTGAVIDNPDVTSQYIDNPSFESNISGWTNTGGTAQWKQNTWDALSNYCEFGWTGNALVNQEVVQTPTLPAGTYKLTVNCASDKGATGLFLIAGDKSVEMNGTGSIGTYSVEFTVASEGPVKLGIKLQNTTATWVNFDNFCLEKVTSSAISHINADKNISNSWYTLDGRRLNAKPTTRGLYIHDGKKIIIN